MAVSLAYRQLSDNESQDLGQNTDSHLWPLVGVGLVAGITIKWASASRDCVMISRLCWIWGTEKSGKNAKPKANFKSLRTFRYTSAAQCKANSPCTNVPIICPLCGPKKAAVWRYCLDTHFREQHNLLPDHFPIKFEMTPLEKKKMAKKWKIRHEKPKKRNMKKKESPLVLSEAHSSHLAPRYVPGSL